jgi:hypothetical protein
MFHSSSYRNFKAYYTGQVMNQHAGAFPFWNLRLA